MMLFWPTLLAYRGFPVCLVANCSSLIEVCQPPFRYCPFPWWSEKKKRQYWCPKQFNLIAYKPVVRPWWINWIGFGLMERIWKDIQKGMASECRVARRGNVHDRDRDDSINNTLWSGHILWLLCSSSMRLNCSRSASWNLTIQTCQARENLVLSQNFSDKQSLVTKTTLSRHFSQVSPRETELWVTLSPSPQAKCKGQ